jgi:hypothetical protein
MLMGAGDRLWVAFVLWLSIMAALEFIRLQGKNPLPWWVIHGPVVAWGAVALIPWSVSLWQGYWVVQSQPSVTVPLSLPATYGFNLLALIGLAVGLVPFAAFGRRAAAEQRVRDRGKVVPGKAFIIILVLLAMYVGSLPSLSNLWSVAAPTGQDLYSSTNGTFLALSLDVLTVVAIAYLAGREKIGWLGVALYLALLVLILGSAHRYLVMILILAYLILRSPKRWAGGSFIQWPVFFILGAAVIWLIGFSGLGQLSILRSGASVSSSSVYTQRTVSSLDVMSSAEYLMETNGRPGQLNGASYLALPGELIPRFLLGARSAPPAIQVVREVFGMKTGASAPLWIEGVLNQGAVGDFLSMVVFAGLWGLLFRRAISSPSSIGRISVLIGPVWILFAYQALSRILMIASIYLLVSAVIGLMLWNWMQADEGSSQPYVPRNVTLPSSARR